MDLIDKYSDRLTADNRFVPDNDVNEKIVSASGTSDSVSTAGQMMTGFLAILISIAAGFIG